MQDDHEVADNTYRDGESRLNNTEASFIQDGGVSVDQRKMNAGKDIMLSCLMKAHVVKFVLILNGCQFGLSASACLRICANETSQVDMDDNLRIWRSFQIGDLLDIIMLDTRQYDRSITDLYWNTNYVHAISNDASRSLMGSQQENWFYRELIESNHRANAVWRVIGSQTGISTPSKVFLKLTFFSILPYQRVICVRKRQSP